MEERADRHVALDSISGARGVNLHQRLMSVAESKEAFRILEQSLSARYPDHRICGPCALGGTTFSMHLHVEDVDSAFEQAVKAGAAVVRALKDEFYGERSDWPPCRRSICRAQAGGKETLDRSAQTRGSRTPAAR